MIQLKYDPPLAVLPFFPLHNHSGYHRLRILVFLLENNANLNELYHGHTLW